MAENFNKIEESEYEYVTHSEPECHALPEMKSDFSKNGYVIVRNLFESSEVERILKAVDNCPHFWEAHFGLKDKEGLKYHSTLWCDPPCDDILGLATKTVKVAGVAEEMLDKGELYLYHAKVNMKQPKTGGAFLWHQDYGYWYNNRCLFPDFVTCFLALTKNDRENGGLEVLKGSHKVGRIDHWVQAGQTGADPERVALLEKVLDQVYCDFVPGDAVFFHANTLHQSKANLSDFKRWNLVLSYNTKENSPDIEHYSACYTVPMVKVPADAVAKCQDLTLEIRNKYMDPKKNINLKHED